jgi:hypothetical protein
MPRPTGSYWSSTSVADSPQLSDLPEADQSGWHSGSDAEPLILHVQTCRTGGDLRLRWRWRDLYQELMICRRGKFVISYIWIWYHSDSYYNGPLPPTAGVLLKTSSLFFSWVKIALKRRISAGPCVRLWVDSWNEKQPFDSSNIFSIFGRLSRVPRNMSCLVLQKFRIIN